jgi:integral membrane protein (TIGR01906 family)
LGLVRHLAALLFIIAVPVALITTNARIAVNEPRLYEYAADHYDTPDATGIEREELLRASDELRDYFNNDEESVFIQVPEDGRLVSLFTPRETAHLRDVKNLFQGSFRVQEGAVMFVLAYVVAVFIWAREGSLRTLARQLLLSGALSLLVIGGVGAVAVTGFDTAFERFHVIAFDNDLWKLDPATDHLIQMFPEDFWRQVSVWLGIATLVELAVLALSAFAYLALTRRETASLTLAGGAPAQTVS